MKENNTKLHYLPELDGLKGICLLWIAAFYFFQFLMPGGYIAVHILLFISGFLNFRSLYISSKRNETAYYKEYYRIRLATLFYPMLCMMAVTTVIIMLVMNEHYINLRGIGFTSLFFVNNLYQMYHQMTYFSQTMAETPFVHLWYVSVYAQLILVTPIIDKLTYRWHRNPLIAFNLIIGLMIIPIVYIVYLASHNAALSRFYFDPIIRSIPYLMGGAMAFLLPTSIQKTSTSQPNRLVMSGLGTVVFLVCWIMARYMYGTQVFAYRYSVLVITICSVGLVLSILIKGTLWHRICCLPVLVQLGKRIYAYYLWLYPVVLLTGEKFATITIPYWLYLFIQFLIWIGLSELTYQMLFIKNQSVLRGENLSFSKLKHQLLQWRVFYKVAQRDSLMKMIVGSIVIIVGMIGLLLSPTRPSGTMREISQQIAMNHQLIEESQQQRHQNTITIRHVEGLDQQINLYANALEVTFFGDDYLTMAAHRLVELFPQSIIDVQTSRQLYHSVSEIVHLKEDNLLASNVVVLFGMSGQFTAAQLDDFIEAIGNQRMIYFVLTASDHNSIYNQNQKLFEAAQRYGNVRVMDWTAEQNSQNDYFYTSLYLNDNGALALSKFIASELYRQR